MDFKLFILLSIITLLTYGAVYYYLIIIIDKKNKLKEMEIKNNQYSLFSNLEPKLIEEEIDNLIDKYINIYYINYMIPNNIDYLRKDYIEKMVKELTKQIIMDISELYIFYIKCLVSIKSDQDLLTYIHKKVKEHVLTFVTDYNKPKAE